MSDLSMYLQEMAKIWQVWVGEEQEKLIQAADALEAIEWRPMNDSARDECPVAIQYVKGFVEGCPWITATKDQSWPDDAFSPHYRPLSKPPEGI